MTALATSGLSGGYDALYWAARQSVASQSALMVIRARVFHVLDIVTRKRADINRVITIVIGCALGVGFAENVVILARIDGLARRDIVNVSFAVTRDIAATVFSIYDNRKRRLRSRGCRCLGRWKCARGDGRERIPGTYGINNARGCFGIDTGNDWAAGAVRLWARGDGPGVGRSVNIFINFDRSVMVKLGETAYITRLQSVSAGTPVGGAVAVGCTAEGWIVDGRGVLSSQG